MNTNYKNEKQEKDFQNIEKYKPITESNKQVIEQIEKKNDEMVKNIVNSLPYYNNKDKKEEQLTLPFDGDKVKKNEL